ncbi:crotonobetainyl-CoA:carnitine CoA-transferase CaiB-like acyl-CoA transferase [Aurantimicrobium minutum]|uniref:CaiB/BaiF CoA transferase family protein n=1 Tax=Aurantimicrobium minutum TaxID=708131 RepID=UPI002477290A|nr:CoA transferase [Aurantimicrobium minutum]MDH6277392.1 crotonobetainyl-CoA:carnitine CoA-transferase CaiB-like acyl-CoA transferase [Aurantimicrobium minutum]
MATPAHANDGILSGIRVLDFSRVLAGPYATMTLADFGADVIKIESADGDDTRGWRPPVDGQGVSTYFSSVNRNKRSVILDLRSPEGKAQAQELLATADVVIENFRPGVMTKLGFNFEEAKKINPGIIYCSITGFGSGKGAGLAGYDLLVQALGGLMSVTGPQDGGPTKVGVALIDIMTGMNAVQGILLALTARKDADPGQWKGQLIQVDLMTTLLAAMTNQASAALNAGVTPVRLGNAHPSISPYELYDAHDRPLLIAVGNDKQFHTLVRLMEMEHLATDPRFADNPSRATHREQLRELLEGVLTTQPGAHWVALLSAEGVPAGLVNTLPEAFDFADSLGLDAVVEIPTADGEHQFRQVVNPIHIPGRGASYRLAPPSLGEHSEDVRWLSLDKDVEGREGAR